MAVWGRKTKFACRRQRSARTSARCRTPVTLKLNRDCRSPHLWLAAPPANHPWYPAQPYTHEGSSPSGSDPSLREGTPHVRPWRQCAAPRLIADEPVLIANLEIVAVDAHALQPVAPCALRTDAPLCIATTTTLREEATSVATCSRRLGAGADFEAFGQIEKVSSGSSSESVGTPNDFS